MTTFVQPNIQVSATDISNAIFASLQEKLTIKYNNLCEIRKDISNKASVFADAYIEEATRLAIEHKKEELELLSRLLSISSKKEIVCTVVPDVYCNSYATPGAYYIQHTFSFSGARITPIDFKTKLNNDNEDDYCFIAGFEVTAQSSPWEFEHETLFTTFKNQITGLKEEYQKITAQLDEVKRLIDGQVNSKTGLSLRDEIKANIAVQAINQIPTLAAQFNMDLIESKLGQKLLGSS